MMAAVMMTFLRLRQRDDVIFQREGSSIRRLGKRRRSKETRALADRLIGISEYNIQT